MNESKIPKFFKPGIKTLIGLIIAIILVTIILFAIFSYKISQISFFAIPFLMGLYVIISTIFAIRTRNKIKEHIILLIIFTILIYIWIMLIGWSSGSCISCNEDHSCEGLPGAVCSLERPTEGVWIYNLAFDSSCETKYPNKPKCWVNINRTITE